VRWCQVVAVQSLIKNNTAKVWQATYTVSPKKWYTKLMVITLSILNGFPIFFYCWKEKEISDKMHIIIITIPSVCCCTTFRSSIFCISRRRCKRKYKSALILNTHPILMHLAYLLTCSFNFWFLINILCK